MSKNTFYHTLNDKKIIHSTLFYTFAPVKIKIQHKSHSIRFRHFSRKAYAVFNSIHKQISIGKTCATLADKSLLKSKTIDSLTTWETFIELKNQDEDDENTFLVDLHIVELLTAIQTTKAAAASQGYTVRNIFKTKPYRGSMFVLKNKRMNIDPLFI